MAAFGHFERDNGGSLPSLWVKIDQYHLVTTVVRGCISFYIRVGKGGWGRVKKLRKAAFVQTHRNFSDEKQLLSLSFQDFFLFHSDFIASESQDLFELCLSFTSRVNWRREKREVPRELRASMHLSFFALWGQAVWWRQSVGKSFRSDQKDYF